MFFNIFFMFCHVSQLHVEKNHVMPREKRCEALDSCFRLVGPHQQSIPKLLSLASRVYERGTSHAGIL